MYPINNRPQFLLNTQFLNNTISGLNGPNIQNYGSHPSHLRLIEKTLVDSQKSTRVLRNNLEVISGVMSSGEFNYNLKIQLFDLYDQPIE